MRRILRQVLPLALALVSMTFASAVYAQFGVYTSSTSSDSLGFGYGVFSSALPREADILSPSSAELEDSVTALSFSDVFVEELAADAESSRPVVYGAFLDEPILYRGQSSLIPPVESSSRTASSTPIGESLVASSTSSVSLPPVIGSDRPFEPVQAQTTSDSTTLQKLFKNSQSVSGSYLFIPRGKQKGLGVHELDGRILFAFPCRTMQNLSSVNNGYFLLSPSFTYTNFSLSHTNDSRIKMPTNVFDAGLTTSFMAQCNDLMAKVEFSVGVASSFKKIHCNAIYFRGRAEVSLAVDNEKQIRALGGVAYLDRIHYKLVPIFGLTWTPNEQNKFRLVFPDPRWDHYLTKVNETDWWFYLNGNIGGGRWYMSDLDAPVRSKTSYNVDYNDYRFGAGLNFNCTTGLKGGFEVGGAFKRELRTKAGKEYTPRNSVYLKVGLYY